MVKDFFKKMFAAPKLEVVKQLPQEGPREIIIHESPVGSPGTAIYSGYIQEDYLDALDYTLKADIYDKMRRGDANVKMLLSAVKNPIKAATWEIEKGEDTPEAEADAALVRHILFHGMAVPFKKFMSEALTMVDFGFSLFEVTHKAVLGHPEFGPHIGLKSLSWRSQRTIQRWNVDRDTGDLLSVVQYAYGDLNRLVTIPAEFLLLFNLDQEGANYEGISMLRACYGNWLRKNVYLKLNAAGIEKFAIPTPVATIPDGKQGSSQFTNLVRILQAFTSHQSNYITKPEGWELDFNTNNTYDPAKVETSIDNEDKRMSKAFLANFLELIGGGSYALSSDLSDFFLSGLDHIASEISSKINTSLIPHLIKINRGERAKYPILKHSGISDRAGKELAEIMSSFSREKIIIPDDQLEDHVRTRYGLPARSMDGQRVSQPQPFNDFSKTLSERLGRAKIKRLEWGR